MESRNDQVPGTPTTNVGAIGGLGTKHVAMLCRLGPSTRSGGRASRCPGCGHRRRLRRQGMIVLAILR